MPFMQPSGAIKLSEMQARFGGSNPAAMSEYYRGGAYVKDEKTEEQRDPEAGYKLSLVGARYLFYYYAGKTQGAWNRTIAGFDWVVTGTVTEHLHTDGWTYRRGSDQGSGLYSIYRTRESAPTPINQHVPESGTISMSDWYNTEYGV